MATGKHDSFGFLAFVWRWAAATVLVLMTFNPSGYSWFHWVHESFSTDGLAAAHYFTGMLLLAAWAVFLIATQRSLGTLGIVILIALVGTGIWLLVDVGVIRVESTRAVTWLVLLALGLVLAVGLSWAHVWRRLSGQLEVDDSED